MKTNLLGVVLCGGLSTRMGEDKGMIKVREEERWAEKMFALLSSVAPTVISINETQEGIYNRFFDHHQLVVDLPIASINGPLRGMLSVYEKFPQHDLIILPCDLIDFDEKALSKIYEAYESDKKHEVIAPLSQNYLQPLAATIYRVHGLDRIKAWVEDESLKNRSMMHVLRRLNTHGVLFDPSFDYAFQNFNHPSDLGHKQV